MPTLIWHFSTFDRQIKKVVSQGTQRCESYFDENKKYILQIRLNI